MNTHPNVASTDPVCACCPTIIVNSTLFHTQNVSFWVNTYIVILPIALIYIHPVELQTSAQKNLIIVNGRTDTNKELVRVVYGQWPTSNKTDSQAGIERKPQPY